jgi:glycosyltransferase involved in cell wall biosynthesis
MKTFGKRQRILIFASAFPPDTFSEGIVNGKLALAFLERGWDLRVISRAYEGPSYTAGWQPPWSTLEPYCRELRYPTGNSASRLWDIWRHSVGLGYLVPGIRWVTRAVDLAIRWHRERPFSIVMSRSPSDVGHLTALQFSLKTGVPWAANWNDPPAHLWPAPYGNTLGAFSSFNHRRLCARVLTRAAALTFPCERLSRHVLQKTRSLEHKVTIVPHIGMVGWRPSVDLDHSTFRLCHAGNLSHERNPETLFAGLSRFLLQEKPKEPVELTVLGVQAATTLEYARKHRVIESVKIIGTLAYLETLQRLARNHVLVLVEADCREGIFLPSKVADYAQAGRPILAVSPQNGTLTDLIGETGAGLAADCRDAQAVADALRRFYKSWKRQSLTEEFPSASLWDRFAPETVTLRYEQLFSAIATGSAPGKECREGRWPVAFSCADGRRPS